MARRTELTALVRFFQRDDSQDPGAAEAKLWRGLTALALILLFAHAAWVRWQMLNVSPYPLGVDGYFYPIQVRSLLERGHLYYPASPLTFWLMAPLAALLGDPILGAKLGAALGSAAVVGPAYALGKRLADNALVGSGSSGSRDGSAGSGGGRLGGLIAAVVAVSSTGSLLLSAEFVKNAFGVTFGLAALAALLSAVDDPGARRRWALAALAFVAALFTHKMATALVLVLGAPPLGALALRHLRHLRHLRALRARRRGRFFFAVAGAALVAALVGLIGLGALAPGRFLSLSHLELLRGLFSGAWRPDAPALAVGTFVLPLAGEPALAGMIARLALVFLLGRALRAHLQRDRARERALLDDDDGAAAPRRPSRLAAWPLVLLGLLLAWPSLNVEDPQGLGFRLRLIAFVPLSLGAAVVAGLLIAELRASGLSVLVRLASLPRLALLVALGCWLALAPTRLDRGVVYAHPAMIAAVNALASAVPPGETIIVSERHIAFMATWYTRLPTVVHPIGHEGDGARRWRLLPLAFIGNDTPLSRAIDAARLQPALVAPRGLHPKHHNGLVVMPEATWQWVLTQLPPAPRRYYQAWRAL